MNITEPMPVIAKSTAPAAPPARQETDLIDAKVESQMWRRIALALYAEGPDTPARSARLALRYAVTGDTLKAIDATPSDFWGRFVAMFTAGDVE